MIDAHHHLWDPGAREYEWLAGDQSWASDEEIVRLRRPCTLAELAPLAADVGVTGTVAVQTVNDVWETQDLLALAAGIDPYGSPSGVSPGGNLPANLVPGRNLLAGVVGWVDVAAPNVADSVAQLRSGPGGSFLCGVRHPLLSEPDPHWLTRPEVLEGLRQLGNEGLSFDLLGLPHHLGPAVVAAQRITGLSFVLDHMGGPPVETSEPIESSPWEAAIRSLGALENVTVKLSGMHGQSASADQLRPFYDTVLDSFGPDRMMFGSDWPVSSLCASYGAVYQMYWELTADLTAVERDAIFQHTARRVYRLDASVL